MEKFGTTNRFYHWCYDSALAGKLYHLRRSQLGTFQNIAERARMIRSHGQRERYIHEVLGYNYRMTEMAAAIGICQLKKLDEFNRQRIEHARFLTEKLGKIRGLIIPFVAPDVRHVFNQFTIRVTGDFGMSREKLRQRLKAKGIMTEVYYPQPIHKQPLYKELGYKL